MTKKNSSSIILFLAVVVMIMAGLAWLTYSSLKIEEEHRLAQKRAERSEKVRLALWRLDNRVYLPLSLEGFRRFEDYTALYVPPNDFSLGQSGSERESLSRPGLGQSGSERESLSRPGLGQSGSAILSPLVSTSLLKWMAIHVQLDPQTGWSSPQVLQEKILQRLKSPDLNLDLANIDDKRHKQLEAIQKTFAIQDSIEQLKQLDAETSDQSVIVVSENINNNQVDQKLPLPGILMNISPTISQQQNPLPYSGTNRSGSRTNNAPAPIQSQTQDDTAQRRQSLDKTVRDAQNGFVTPQPSQVVPPLNASDQKKDINIDDANKNKMGDDKNLKAGEQKKDTNLVPSAKFKDNKESSSETNRNSPALPAAKKSTVPSPSPPEPTALPPQPTALTPKESPPPSSAMKEERNSPKSSMDQSKNEFQKLPVTPEPRPGVGGPGVGGLGVGGPGAGEPVANQPGPPGGFGGASAGPAGPVASPLEKPATPVMPLAINGNLEMADEKQKAKNENTKKTEQDIEMRAIRKPAPNAPPTPVHLGTMRPIWLKDINGKASLFIFRSAKLEHKIVYQGIFLDWEELSLELRNEIQDDFPNASLIPQSENDSPSQQLTALPVTMNPGELTGLIPAGWTPLRVGLVLSWLAAIASLAAAWFVGSSLMDLSERRMRFVSAVTHELRTPLTSLRLYLDMLTSGMVKEEEQKQQYLNTLSHESERLNQLIENVLDFARLEKRSVQIFKSPVAVADILSQLTETWQERLLADDKEFLAMNTTSANEHVETDARILLQVLGNLIDNARKYTAGADDNRVWLWVKKTGDQIAFDIEDRGPGIVESDRKSIFKPFSRGETSGATGGAGLGLALAKQWIEMLGGQVSYRPADGGVGSIFRVVL